MIERIRRPFRRRERQPYEEQPEEYITGTAPLRQNLVEAREIARKARLKARIAMGGAAAAVLISLGAAGLVSIPLLTQPRLEPTPGDGIPGQPLVPTPGPGALTADGETQLVQLASGRIWQPNIPTDKHVDYIQSFVYPDSAPQKELLFNGVNAALYSDNGDGKLDPEDKLLAKGANGVPVTLEPGRVYHIRGYGIGGGVALDPKDPKTTQ